MSDESDRERNGRRRRRRPGRKERERERESVHVVTPTKPPIILAKPDRVSTEPVRTQEPSKVQPVFTLKTRDDKPLASFQNSPAFSMAQQTHQSQPVYHIQSRKPSQSLLSLSDLSSHSKLSSSVMTKPIKLIDEQFLWYEAGVEVLQDQTDYLVVGVIGLQGSGKSTILSLLAGNKASDPSRSYVFPTQTQESRETSRHQTSGVDIYVTTERTILLDVQPVLSASILDNMIQYDKKYSSEYSAAENCIEIQSLQLVTFLTTVCHVVLVVQDWFTDVNLLRFLQTAEMLKPSTPSSHEAPDEMPEYYPHIVFVQNKAKRENFNIDNFKVMQNVIQKSLKKSKLNYRGNISMGNVAILPSLQEKMLKKDINLYLFPHFDIGKSKGNNMTFLPEYRGFPSLELLQKNFRNQILSMPRSPLTHSTLSEKNWFQYAARQWDAIKKSSLLSEYNRLLT